MSRRQYGSRESRLAAGVRESLGFKADAVPVMAETLLLSPDAFQIIACVELHAGAVGEHGQGYTAFRRGKAGHLLKLSIIREYIAVVIAMYHLQLIIIIVYPFSDGMAVPEIHRGVRYVQDPSCGNRRSVQFQEMV